MTVKETSSSAALNGASPTALTLALGCVEVLGRLSALFVERRRQLAESVGLTDQQWHALEEIQTEHFMPSLFARERESSAAAVSKILRQLTDKGLVTGHVATTDARHRSYQVTARGRETLTALREGRHQAIRKAWLPLEVAELSAFQAIGTRIAENLETLSRETRMTPEPKPAKRAPKDRN